MKARLSLKVVHVLSRPPWDWRGVKGILNAEVLGDLLRGLPKESVFFVCGPKGMIESAQKTLRTAGIPLRQIHFEHFFSGDDLEEIAPDIVSFRSMSKMTSGQRDSALGAGAIALLLNDWIEARILFRFVMGVSLWMVISALWPARRAARAVTASTAA